MCLVGIIKWTSSNLTSSITTAASSETSLVCQMLSEKNIHCGFSTFTDSKCWDLQWLISTYDTTHRQFQIRIPRNSFLISCFAMLRTTNNESLSWSDVHCDHLVVSRSLNMEHNPSLTVLTSLKLVGLCTRHWVRRRLGQHICQDGMGKSNKRSGRSAAQGYMWG